MEYKEFKVIILNKEQILAFKPFGGKVMGEVQKDYLKKRTIKILIGWLAEDRIKKREELVILGSYLYEVLFSGAIGTEFKSNYDKIKKMEDTVLRVVLEFEQEVQELATMPWEYLYFPDKPKEKGFFIATRSKLILTRHVPLTVALEDLKPRKKPLRILIVVSEPKDLTIVDSKPVIRAIEKLKRKLPDDIMTDRLKQPNKRTFTAKVKKFRPHVIHFIGHGSYDKQGGHFAFVRKGKKQLARWINDVDLADCFVDFQPRLIFLNACKGADSESYEGFSGLALQFVYANIPAVVAMRYPINNKTSIKFAETFYKCLGEGEPIDVAVQKGRQELGMYLDEKNFSSRVFGSPVVYLQSAEGIIIAKKPEVVTSPEKQLLVLCPNTRTGCRGKVLRTENSCDAKCIVCKHRLELCPNPKCKEIMSTDVGECAACGYSKKVSAVEVKQYVTKPELTDLKKIVQTGKISAFSQDEEITKGNQKA